MEFHVRLVAFSNFLIENNMQAFLDYFVSTWVNSSFCFWRIFDTIPGVGNTNNAVEAFHRHFKASFLDNKKYPMDQLVQVICWMIRFYSCKDMNFAVCFSPEAKHKQRAQSLLTMNAVIGNCFYPNPYTVVTNEDATYTWVKGFPLPASMHKRYTVSISTQGNDYCRYGKFFFGINFVFRKFKKKKRKNFFRICAK